MEQWLINIKQIEGPVPFGDGAQFTVGQNIGTEKDLNGKNVTEQVV